MAGAVNLYTRQFFALMKSRLKPDGVVTFWLPIYQLQLSDTKSILRAFHEVFGNASVWASSDEEWIMVGINGPGGRLTEADVASLWKDNRHADLLRIGVEVPEQIGSLFLMDSETIEAITATTSPLTDLWPKRLSDLAADPAETDRFAAEYFDAPKATERFRASKLIDRIWPASMRKGAEAGFVIRDRRFQAETRGSNALAELDFYLRRSRLRAPVLEVLQTDEFRLAIAEEAARKSSTVPPAAAADLVAGALARRDFGAAISLLEPIVAGTADAKEEARLLTYLYCLDGKVEKAEQLAAARGSACKRDPLVDWLWGKLQAEYGFRPPS